MQGKELLKNFRKLPEQEQNKILVEAFAQIASRHDAKESFGSFGWADCTLENGALTINAPVNKDFNGDILQSNIMDYARLVYCLATGNSSAEAMGWDAGRKIQSAVLREIVLTLSGRNYSVEPLLYKLRKPYVDEDTFFDDYDTVDEKESRDAYEKQQEINALNRADEIAHNPIEFPGSDTVKFTSGRSRWETIIIFICIALCVGGVKACRYSKKMKSQHPIEIRHHYPMNRPVAY